jgi:hypothetical protein
MEDGTNSISRILQSYEASLGLPVALSKGHSADSNGRVVQDSDGAVQQEHLNYGFESRLVYVRVIRVMLSCVSRNLGIALLSVTITGLLMETMEGMLYLASRIPVN